MILKIGNKFFRLSLFLTFFVLFILSFKIGVFAEEFSNSLINMEINGQDITGQTDPILRLLFLITIITLAPTILIMLTCFTRVIICLHFIRSALSTQSMPPNQVLIGLALFITLFVMGPTFSKVNEMAIVPYSNGELTSQEMIEVGMEPIRDFMFLQVSNSDLKLFAELDNQTYENYEDIPSRVLIPAFILGEITKGFIFGFVIYIPFIVIDMIVASILMAMGMMMLPPSMISLPFKILFFVLVDGWSLMVGSIVESIAR